MIVYNMYTESRVNELDGSNGETAGFTSRHSVRNPCFGEGTNDDQGNEPD